MSENSPETRPAGAVKTLVVEDVPFSFRWPRTESLRWEAPKRNSTAGATKSFAK